MNTSEPKNSYERLSDKGTGVASAQTAQAMLFYNLDGTVSAEPQK